MDTSLTGKHALVGGSSRGIGQAIAEPSEIANAVAFLASPAASYINGINLPVDGGMILSL